MENARKIMAHVSQSLHDVFQMQGCGVQLSDPSGFSEHAITTSMAALIGITGQVQGTFLLAGDVEHFQSLSNQLYGMQLEGEMLQSFVGEISNMIMGNVCRLASEYGLLMDITPPAMFSGEVRLAGITEMIPVRIQNADVMLDVYVSRNHAVA